MEVRSIWFDLHWVRLDLKSIDLAAGLQDRFGDIALSVVRRHCLNPAADGRIFGAARPGLLDLAIEKRPETRFEGQEMPEVRFGFVIK